MQKYRIQRKMLLWENRAFKDGFSIIVGMDEAGRGPLAGPVVAAAVILSSPDSREFIHSRPKTAAFRPRICSGRSVFRPQEPRALVLRGTEGLARVGSIRSRPQNHTLKGVDGALPLSISLQETAGFSPRSFIFPEYKERIDDSKKLAASQRERSYREILKKSIFGLGIKDRRFIDKKNIHAATLAAMREAVKNLIKKYCRLINKEESDIRNDICVLVDGNCKPLLPYRIIPIVRGDSKSLSVAAASIVAKVERDRMMTAYDKIYPLYGFSRHKGYGTRFHFEALEMHGPCAIHRRSFTLIRTKKNESYKT